MKKSEQFSHAENFLGKWFRFFNLNESHANFPDHGESWSWTFVLDIPLQEFDKDMMDDLDREFKGSSHGVEGNAGGVCSHGWVSEPILVSTGDFSTSFERIEIEHSCVLDI